MKKTLFKVHVDTYLVVEGHEAANEHDIYWATRQYISDHLGDVGFTDITFEELESIENLPQPWTPDCLPFSTEYYSKDDRTIGEILGDELC